MEFEDEQEGEAGPRPSYIDNSMRPRYKECLKNQALGIGGNAVDGCGEFIPAGDEGTLEYLMCAACNCHRNFHRKENEYPPQQQLLLTHPHEHFGYHLLQSSSGGGKSKRFRTKFTQEQKDKMLSLAERLDWKIQKQDEAIVQQFCNEAGVKRHVLKVWVHNNKHTLGKKT